MNKIALAFAAMIALAPAAHAGGMLTFGGATLCSIIIKDTATPGNAQMAWGVWMLGYWSGLNSTLTPGWVGEKLESWGVIREVTAECQYNPHMTLQDAEDTVFNRVKMAGQ